MSVNARARSYAQAPALSWGERRLVDWLELRCYSRVPKERAGLSIGALAARYGDGLGGFVGARRLLLKFGWRHVVSALQDMTFKTTPEFEVDGRPRRYFREEIVSPAQYLNWLCGELAGEIRRPRRRYSDEGER